MDKYESITYLRLTQEDKESLNSPVSIKIIETIVKNLTKKIWGPDNFVSSNNLSRGR